MKKKRKRKMVLVMAPKMVLNGVSQKTVEPENSSLKSSHTQPLTIQQPPKEARITKWGGEEDGANISRMGVLEEAKVTLSPMCLFFLFAQKEAHLPYMMRLLRFL